MFAASCLLYEDQFLCSICLDVFTDPVSTPCGHNFCKTCITRHWNVNVHCVCYQCKKVFYIRPEMKVNTLIRQVTAEFRYAQQVLKTEEVKKLLKIIQQFAVDVTLDPDTAHPYLILSDDEKQVHCGDVRKNLPDNPQRFDRCPCVLGKQSFSKGRFYYEVQVKGMTEWTLGVTRELSNRKGDIRLRPQDGYWTVMLWNENGFLAHDDPPVRLSIKSKPEKVGVFVDYEEGLVSFYDVDAEALIFSFTGCSFTHKLLPYFNPWDNDDGQNSAPLIISAVSFPSFSRSQCVDMFAVCCLLYEDQFLCSICRRVFTDPVSTPCGHNFCKTCITRHWNGKVQCVCYQCEEVFYTRPELRVNMFIRQMTAEFRYARLVHKIEAQRIAEQVEEAKELLEKVELEKVELKRIQQFAVDVTLDPDTAHPYLILSDDEKQAHHGDVRKNLPDNPQRFDPCPCVLGKQSFSSGRFYFEVQVKGKTAWALGVTRESSDRKGIFSPSPQDGYWTVWFWNENEFSAYDDPLVCLSIKSKPTKVGVFVDYEEGLVSFYDVDTAALIFSFTGCSFTHKLLPFFSPWLNDGGINSAPLIISAVSHTQ